MNGYDRLIAVKTNQIQWVLNIMNDCKDYLSEAVIQKLLNHAQSLKTSCDSLAMENKKAIDAEKSLQTEQQRLVYRMFQENFTRKEIANYLGCSTRTVSRTNRRISEQLESRC